MENFQARLGSVAVASPPCSMDQDQIQASIRKYYAHRLSPRSMGVIQKVFNHPSVLRRRFAFDKPEQLVDEHPDHRVDRFTRWGIDLSEQAARKAMEKAGITVDEVAGIIVNTCTGYLCPGLSTYLVERLGLKRSTYAYDLVGSGCGGAIPNLQLSLGILNQNPGGVVLSVAVEICTGTFQMADDLSLIVSNAIFADGASAYVLWNRPKGLKLVDSATRHAPEYREDIRYVYKNGQLHNQLSLKLPQLAGEVVGELVGEFLRPHGLAPGDIKYWALHPGGENVINAVQNEIGLTEKQLRATRDILAQYGNMSSATVGFVLHDILEKEIKPGDWCLMVAFGAGMSAHTLLLQA